MMDELLALANKAGVATIHISITTEKDFATAFVVAESIHGRHEQ